MRRAETESLRDRCALSQALLSACVKVTLLTGLSVVASGLLAAASVRADTDSDGDGLSDLEESGKAFVTSSTHTGNLGGLAGGDAICQGLATGAGIAGEARAWLSSSSTDAKNRIWETSYFRTDGALVANDLADLTDGSIANH